MMKGTPLFLLVEDDPNDVVMATLAFEAMGLKSELATAYDGRDALDYLQRSGPHVHRPAGLPCLILLDLNMPRMNGFDLLTAVKQDAVLTQIPIFIFTTSNAERDRSACAKLGADDYLVKPQAFEALLTLMGNVTAPWLNAGTVAM